jgi:HD-like signal output (HDOD) protein
MAQEVLKLASDDMASVVSLGKIIDKDVSISAKILSVANSAYFGFSSNVKTMSDAILRIGFLNVKNISFGLSLMSVFENEKKKKVLDYERIFEHSVNVGVVAKLLAKEAHLSITEDILINGLLHDIGFLALCHYFLQEYDSVMYNFHHYEDKPLLDAEKHILDFTHADMGSWLTEKWNLDRTVVDTTLFHHAPSQAKSNLEYVSVVHLADYLTSEQILSVTKKNPVYPLDSAALEEMGLSEEDLNELKTVIEQKLFL